MKVIPLLLLSIPLFAEANPTFWWVATQPAVRPFVLTDSSVSWASVPIQSYPISSPCAAESPIDIRELQRYQDALRLKAVPEQSRVVSIKLPADSWYDYPCEAIKVIDGDTVDLLVRPTPFLEQSWRVRLAGIDAPEMSTPQGPKAKEHLAALILDCKRLRVSVRVTDRNQIVRDKYGRILAELRDTAGTTLNEKMIKDGFAKEYHGGKRE